jgi:hypothetical protein
MKVKTNTLVGPALDWAACLANGYDEGWLRRQLTNPNPSTRAIPKPSTDHAQGGPIIERERMTVGIVDGDDIGWTAWMRYDNQKLWASGPTLLTAAMRCYVASKLGDEVDIPDELT